MGIPETDFSYWVIERKFKNKLQELKEGVPGGLLQYIKETKRNLESIEKIIAN